MNCPYCSGTGTLKDVGRADLLVRLRQLGYANAEGRDRVRMLVRIRDNFTCRDCGEVRLPSECGKGKRYERNLDIHHLGEMCGQNSRGYDSLDAIDDLITLCHKCHFNRPEHHNKRNAYFSMGNIRPLVELNRRRFNIVTKKMEYINPQPV